MKRFLAIVFFVCLAFKPAYNIGFVSYYKLNINTIVEKYCINKAKPKLKCNGKCYLKKQLQLTQTSDSDTSKKAILKSFAEVFFPVYFQNNIDQFTLFNIEEYNRINSFIPVKANEWLIAIQTPPPRV